MNKKIGIIIGIVIAFGVGFFGGEKYAASQVSATIRTNGSAGMMGQIRFGQFGGRGGMGMNGGAVVGTILSKDAISITVGLQGGGSKIVFVSQGTMISKRETASTTDLGVNDTVIVSGTPNSDGSISAQSIQLGADLSRRMMQGTGTQQPAQTTQQ